MKNKTLAIFGIGAYILSVVSSATDLEGNSIVPDALIVISGVIVATFIIMAVVRIWKSTRGLSIVLASSASVLLALTIVQTFNSSPFGSPIIILTNIAKVIYIIVYIWVIVKLFKLKDNKQ